MTAWIMSILSIVIIGVLVELLMPTGRMRNYLKSIFATVTVLIIALPLPSLVKNGFSIENPSLIQNEFVLDEQYLEYSNSLKLRYLEKGVEKALENDGVVGAIVEIEGDMSSNIASVKFVRINLANVVIDENKQHINKYELIWDLVTAYLGVEKSVVLINE